jgi:hypothetical protein
MMIAGGGFAMMAWNEACRRTTWAGLERAPMSRHPSHVHWSCDFEYHRILTNATQGFMALAVARRLNMLGDDPRVIL